MPVEADDLEAACASWSTGVPQHLDLIHLGDVTRILRR